MKLIDTHCHVQFPHYDEDRSAVIQRAFDAGVGMICVGTDLEMSRKAVELAREYPDMWATVGLHPNDNLSEAYSEGAYEELARDQKVVAIGEVGLDYYRTTGDEAKKTQRARFERQVALAERVGKPLVIHCREAHDDMRAILAETSAKGIIHSFTGTAEDAFYYIEHGFLLGLNGIMTFSDSYVGILRAVDLSAIVLETDAPYLSPAPYRGKRNEPGHVALICDRIAEIKGVSSDDLAEQTTSNVYNSILSNVHNTL